MHFSAVRDGLSVWLSENFTNGVLGLMCLVALLGYCAGSMLRQRESEKFGGEKMLESKGRDPLNLSGVSTSRTVTESASEILAVDQETMCQAVKQPYDAFLVLDVEATCVEGPVSFDYPNEIIEWPVCLLGWKDMSSTGIARELEVVEEFRSFVKPTWRPQLTPFCKDLTGITQEQVDNAPSFTELLQSFRQFLELHGLIEPITSRRLIRYCWCSDGPFDIRDFVVKQCFISKVPMPSWLTGDVLDVRHEVRIFHNSRARKPKSRTESFALPTRISLSIPQQLRILGLDSFQGRQHSGIDDTRNITRIIIELARRGVKLKPNTAINPKRRWPWMGKRGKVLDGYH